MNGVIASALTVHSYHQILTNHSLEKGPRRYRSPNKGHGGQEMARKFGLLCLVQVSNFFLQVAKICEFSIPLLDP